MVSRKSSLVRLLASRAAGVDPVWVCVPCRGASSASHDRNSTRNGSQPANPPVLCDYPFSLFSQPSTLHFFSISLLPVFYPLVFCRFYFSSKKKSSDKRQISFRRLRFPLEPLNWLNFTTPAINVSPDNSLSLDSSYFPYR